MHAEWTGLKLRQWEHIRGHLFYEQSNLGFRVTVTLAIHRVM
jgi:hypothetical protein